MLPKGINPCKVHGDIITWVKYRYAFHSDACIIQCPLCSTYKDGEEIKNEAFADGGVSMEENYETSIAKWNEQNPIKDKS